MNEKQIYYTIKLIVKSLLPESKVLLFGSRVRGLGDSESDYDLLIITRETFSSREKMNWENKIRKALITSLMAPFDVLVESEKDVNEKKSLVGHIIYHAMKEAVEI